MERYKLQLPSGVEDILPGECFHKRKIESRLLDLFARSGFEEIETPAMEYYDVFAGASGFIRQEQMIKLLDHEGRILVLRPDLTMPISRIAATKMRDVSQPLRLCYVQDTFVNASANGHRVSPQAGIELIGEQSVYADAEVIALSIQSLLECGLSSFQVDLGQVSFFKGLMEESGLSGQDIEQLRAYVEEKNILDIELFLSKMDIHHSVLERIMILPELYGGEEVLDKAERITSNSRCRAAIENIRNVVHILSDYGYREYISIDLGMVHAIHYYSGIIFKGMTAFAGQPILSGGRYDGLAGEYGYPLPATGFALSIKPVLVALERQCGLQTPPAADIIVGFEPGSHEKAFAEVLRLRESGLRVELSYASVADLPLLAKKKGITRALYFENGAMREVVS